MEATVEREISLREAADDNTSISLCSMAWQSLLENGILLTEWPQTVMVGGRTLLGKVVLGKLPGWGETRATEHEVG